MPPKRKVRVDEAFGRRLRVAMEEAGVRPSDLAEAEEVSQSTVSRWRAGELPDALRFERLAARLGVTERWLRTGEGPRHDGGELAKAHQGREPTQPRYPEAEEGPPEGPGWQFGDPTTWDEEQLRTVIDHLDRTFRGSLTSLDEAGRRQLKVVALRELIRAAREQGRPLPDFAYRFLHELETGER